MRLTLPLLMFALTLSACVATTDKSPTDQALDRWLSRPLSEVISAWGAPANDILIRGKRQVSYPASHFTNTARPANLPLGQKSLVQPDYACQAVLVLNETEIVTAANWVGGECRRPR